MGATTRGPGATARHLQRTIGNQATQALLQRLVQLAASQTPAVQAKLTVGAPDDRYEREADVAANRVVAGEPVQEISRLPAAGLPQRQPEQEEDETDQSPSVQRQEVEEDYELQNTALQRQEKEEEDQGPVQARARTTDSGIDTATAERAMARSGSGSPLSPAVQTQMEEGIGADFSGVRVHTGAAADEANRALNARAFTRSSDIYLARGESQTDRRLMGHELTHVVQQSDTASSSRMQRQEKAGPGTGAAPVKAMGPSKKVNLDLGWLDLAGGGLQTNAQLAAAARLAIASLESDLAEVESASVETQAEEWLRTVKGALPFFDRHASEPINEDIVPLVNHQIDQLAAIRSAIQEDKVARLREALRREQRAAEEAAAESEALQPKMDDALRAAFRTGGSRAVKDAVSAVKSAISIGRNLRSLAESITTDILDLPVPKGTQISVDKWSSQIGRVKVTIVNVNKYTDMLTKFGRGLTAVNIALTVSDRSKRATDVEQGMKDLNDVVNISTDLASLSSVSLPPHMSLMTTLWIKPALKVITAQIGVLVERLSDVNRVSVAVTGDLMYPEAEPGGQAMFDLMVAVMHASDASGVPAIRGRVATYLYDHRDKLEAGAEEAVPTSGWWLWQDLDSTRARTWLFNHRRRVWAMFYGSMEVPLRPRR